MNGTGGLVSICLNSLYFESGFPSYYKHTDMFLTRKMAIMNLLQS
jgi:hypothetical protein